MQRPGRQSGAAALRPARLCARPGPRRAHRNLRMFYTGDIWWLCHRWSSSLNKSEALVAEAGRAVPHSKSALLRSARARQRPVLGKGRNFFCGVWNFFYIVKHSVVSICLLLFHSLGPVCDNSSFFMGSEAIIRS